MAAKRVLNGLKTGLAVVGTLGIGTGIAGSYAFRAVREAKQKLPPEFVLELDLEDIQLVERSTSGSTVQNFGQAGTQLELKQVVEALRLAGSDSRVKGLTALIGANEQFAGLAQIQELRNAVAEFKEQSQGRLPTVAYADAFGAAGAGGTLPYYLATAFDWVGLRSLLNTSCPLSMMWKPPFRQAFQVYMQPSGLLSISGLASSTPFLKDFFSRWKVRPFFVAREEYKNVANQFNESKYTREHREATQALLKGFLGDIVEGVAASRSLPEDEVRRAIDEAPFTAEKAIERGLLDGSLYRDEVEMLVARGVGVTRRIPLAKYIEAEVQSKAKTVDLKDFRALFSHQKEDEKAVKKPVIALIVAAGQIVAGKGSATELQRAPEIASTVMCNQLIKAQNDPNIRAVVIRIDTPGGSAVASDTIYREVLKLRKSGVPVIVSMGNVAASGGYYIAAPANKIVAQPSTVTGSIGVVFGKFNIADTLRQYGINPCTIMEGRNADAQFPFSDWTREQLRQVNHLVDHIYTGFVQKVALGRNMSEAAVRKVAKGRAWTGHDALRHGLVDALGGLQEALALAKQEAGLPLEDGAVDVLDMSAPTPLLKLILQALQNEGGVSFARSLAQLALALGIPALQQQQAGGQVGEMGMLAEMRAKLSDRQQQLQAGPQLISDYVAPK